MATRQSSALSGNGRNDGRAVVPRYLIKACTVLLILAFVIAVHQIRHALFGTETNHGTTAQRPIVDLSASALNGQPAILGLTPMLASLDLNSTITATSVMSPLQSEATQEEDEDECAIENLDGALVCEFVRSHPEECKEENGNMFLLLRYCILHMGSSDESTRLMFTILDYLLLIIFLVISSVVILILFYLLGNTAGDYFVPSLTMMSGYLRMSPNVAGVTLLAFGNGAPDIFAIVAGALKESSDFAVGEPVGAGVFVTTVVMGLVTLASSVKVTRRPFLRDVGFYIFSTLYLFITYIIGKIHLVQALFCLVIYAVYVSVVVVGRITYQTIKKRRLAKKAKIESLNRELSTGLIMEQTVDTGLSNTTRPTLDGDSEQFQQHEEPAQLAFVDDTWEGGWTNGKAPINLASTKFQQSVDTSDDEDEQTQMIKNSVFIPKVGIVVSMHQRKAIKTPQAAKTTEASGNAADEDELHLEKGETAAGTLDIIQPNFLNRVLATHPADAETAADLTGTDIEQAEDADAEGGRAPMVFRDYFNPDAEHLASTQSYVSLETGKPTGPGGTSPINRLFDRFLDSIEWREKKIHEKIIFVLFTWYWIFMRNITIPKAEPKQWNRWFTVVTPIFAIPFVYITMLSLFFGTPQELWSILTYRVLTFLPVSLPIFLIGPVISLVILFTTRSRRPPIYFPFFVFVCFGMCICWIYNVANQLLNVLSAVGLSLNLPPSLLAITVLSWGNSIGDMISDVIIARQGYPSMAVGAIYGSPMMNLLIGIGISMTINCVRNGFSAEKISFSGFCFSFGTPDVVVYLSFIALLISLVTSFVVVPISKFRFRKLYGIFLWALYTLFLVVQLIWIFIVKKYIFNLEKYLPSSSC